MIQCLPELLKQAPGIHIIHQTGERDYNDAQAAYQRAGASAEVFRIYQRHAWIFRAGGFAAVPLRSQHGGGNRRGGEASDFCALSACGGRSSAGKCAGAGAGWRRGCVGRNKLDDVWLVETVSALLGDPPRLRRMSAAARGLAHPNAARDIAAMAAELAGVEKPGPGRRTSLLDPSEPRKSAGALTSRLHGSFTPRTIRKRFIRCAQDDNAQRSG